MLRHAQGEHKEAELLLRDALQCREATLGSQHPDTAACMYSLAMLLIDQGKNDDAAVLLQRALEGQQATLGPNHPETLGSKHNLELILRDHSNLSIEEATTLFARELQ